MKNLINKISNFIMYIFISIMYILTKFIKLIIGIGMGCVSLLCLIGFLILTYVILSPVLIIIAGIVIIIIIVYFVQGFF
jgi:hypothetical protein